MLELKCLLRTASMFLSVPSAEVADERTFSSTGGTLSKIRVNLSSVTIEQLTVVRMYVNRVGVFMVEFDQWVQELLLANKGNKIFKFAKKKSEALDGNAQQ
jgi:hypothetical protein